MISSIYKYAKTHIIQSILVGGTCFGGLYICREAPYSGILLSEFPHNSLLQPSENYIFTKYSQLVHSKNVNYKMPSDEDILLIAQQEYSFSNKNKSAIRAEDEGTKKEIQENFENNNECVMKSNSKTREAVVRSHIHKGINPNHNKFYSITSSFKNKKKITTIKVHLGEGDEVYHNALNFLLSLNFDLFESNVMHKHLLNKLKTYVLPKSSFLLRKAKSANDNGKEKISSKKLAIGDSVAILISRHKFSYKIIPLTVTNIKLDYGIVERNIALQKINNTNVLASLENMKSENGNGGKNYWSVKKDSYSNDVADGGNFTSYTSEINGVNTANSTSTSNINAAVTAANRTLSNSNENNFNLLSNSSYLSKSVLSSVKSSICLSTVEGSSERGSVVFSVVKKRVSSPFPSSCSSIYNQSCSLADHPSFYAQKNNDIAIVNDIFFKMKNLNKEEETDIYSDVYGSVDDNKSNANETESEEEGNKLKRDEKEVWLEISVISDENNRENDEIEKCAHEKANSISEVGQSTSASLLSVFDLNFLQLIALALESKIKKEIIIQKKRKEKLRKFSDFSLKRKKRNKSHILENNTEFQRKPLLASSIDSHSRGYISTARRMKMLPKHLG